MNKIEKTLRKEVSIKNENFFKRYELLFSKEKKKTIVYIKNVFDDTTFRYRYNNIKESLKSSAMFRVTAFKDFEIESILPYLHRIDIIVIQRDYWSLQLDVLIARAQKMKIPVVYDLDDLHYKGKYVPSYLNRLGVLNNAKEKEINYHFAYTNRIDYIVKKCDFVLATNTFLAKKIENDYAKTTFIIKNFLNKTQVDVSEHAIEVRESIKGKYVIGYFSGSSSHQNDFLLAGRQLAALMRKYDNIYLKIVGFLDLGADFEYLMDRVEFKSLVPYPELQYEIAEVDLNIAPLVDSDFNNCKSELKFFEAALVKVPTCASNSFTFKNSIIDGETSFLCKSQEWFDKMEYCYLHEEKMLEIAEKGYKFVLEKYLPETLTEEIENVFQEILSAYKKN